MAHVTASSTWWGTSVEAVLGGLTAWVWAGLLTVPMESSRVNILGAVLFDQFFGGGVVALVIRGFFSFLCFLEMYGDMAQQM